MLTTRSLLMLAGLGLLWGIPRCACAAEPDPAAVEFFEKSVRPLLVEHCQACHGEQKQRGGLRLDTLEFTLKGTDNGPGLVAGKPDESRIIQAIRYDGEVQMPPKEKLPQAAIDILTEWVKQGAVWPATPEKPASEVAGAAQPHWAFQPIQNPPVPVVETAGWARNEIDHFVWQALQTAKLKPSPLATKPTWLRRVTFDVTGLPPTLAEVEAFEADKSPEAYAKVVDRLLASPAYGEKWARHWLDVSRYADTKGYVFQEDRNYPHAYQYRDWVINALNNDLPYDQFLTKQIAADQLVQGDDQSDLAAMGFLTLGRRFLNNIHDIIDDRIDVLTRGTMGLTVNCARCHDHKFDPIPTIDYYALYGVFASSDEPKDGAFPMRLVDKPEPHNVKVFIRGNAGNHGPEAPRKFLEVVAGQDRPAFQKGSGRLELAQAIVAPSNPLTARVMANRIWGHYFGKALVDTPSDFGVRTGLPSHPELLDYLATQLRDQGWSLKKLHRLILLSATYGQNSMIRPEAVAIDSENRLLWRQNRKRMTWEETWDSVLAVSGQLDRTVGGPALKMFEMPQPTRRAIYGFVDRQNLPGTLRTFDFANPDTHAPLRFTTTVPQQALFLLNSPFILTAAEATIKRQEVASYQATKLKTDRIYGVVLARHPSPDELKRVEQFLKTQKTNPEIVAEAPWRYGTAELNPTTKKTTDFQELPHWTGVAWQGGAELPDAKLDWCSLNAAGGHPGVRAVVRRWTSPIAGKVRIEGRLAHKTAEGNGVVSFAISNRKGVVGEWAAHNNSTKTEVNDVNVTVGETIDFVTDRNGDTSHDSFLWDLRVQVVGPEEQGKKWSSIEDFGGPRPPLLGPWEQLAQALLLTNEFAFID